MKSLPAVIELYLDVLSSLVVLKAGAQKGFFGERRKKPTVAVKDSYWCNNPNQINYD